MCLMVHDIPQTFASTLFLLNGFVNDLYKKNCVLCVFTTGTA